MADQIWVYHSKDAPPDKQWLSYLAFDGHRMPISCHGPTEDVVRQKARDLYAIDKAEREANRKRREEVKAAAEKRKKDKESKK